MRSARYRCPNPKCRAILRIPEKLIGKHARCASCGEAFIVPHMLRSAQVTERRFRKAG